MDIELGEPVVDLLTWVSERGGRRGAAREKTNPRGLIKRQHQAIYFHRSCRLSFPLKKTFCLAPPKKKGGGRDALARVFAGLGIRVDDLVDELAHRLLELAVRVGVVGRVVGFRQPGRFGVGHLLELAGSSREDARSLAALDDADPKPSVGWFLEDLSPVETVEDVGRVLTGDVAVDERGEPTGMQLGELGQVIDDRVDDDPLDEDDRPTDRHERERVSALLRAEG